MEQITKDTTGMFDVVNRQTGHVVGYVKIEGGEFVNFTPAQLPGVIDEDAELVDHLIDGGDIAEQPMNDGWDIDGWRAHVRDELLAQDYEHGDPPHGRDEGFAENKEIVERDPCPRCGGHVTYVSYHRRREPVGYTPLVPQYSYRVFGVCRACDRAFEF